MTQMTLSGKPEAKLETEDRVEAESKVRAKPHSENIETDDSGWDEYDHQDVLSRKQEEGYNYTALTLTAKSDLQGIHHSVSVHTTYEQPHDFMGTCYGIGGDFDMDNPQQFFDELMKQKLEQRKTPYKKLTQELWAFDHHSSSAFYRLVPMKNFIVIVPKKLREMMKRKGFDFEQCYREYRAVEENPSTQEYDERVMKAKVLLERGYALVARAEQVKQSIRVKLGKTSEYGQTLIDSFPDMSVDELMKQLGQLHSDAKAINTELWNRHYNDIQYSEDVISGVDEILQVMSR